jgi:predicted enzyme related to lactoylglutathione lyase
VKIYVNVADLEASLAAADAHGGAVLTPRTEVGGDMGWWAEISDPDGRWLGLCTGEPATTAG